MKKLIRIIILLLSSFFTPFVTGVLSVKTKWQQVSRTLLSILTDLNTAVVWMVSILPLISSFPQSLFQTFEGGSGDSNYNWYHRHFHVPRLFSALEQDPGICLFFLFFFTLCFIFTRWSSERLKIFFWLIFFSHTECILLRRWTVPKSASFKFHIYIYT